MYFSKFKKIWYDIDNNEKYRVVTNVLQRVAFRKRLKSEGDLYVEYNMKDGDKPEIIANKLYGSTKFHWVVLLFNDILNPYNEWVKETSTLERNIKNRYKGVPVFVNEVTEEEGFSFKTGDTISLYNVNEFGTPSDPQDATVLATDKTLHKVVLDTVGDLKVGDMLVSKGSTVAQISIFGPTVLKIVQVHEQSVHHFEKDGVILNPLANLQGETYSGSIYEPVPIPFEETLLWSYLNDGALFTNYVSIEQHEINENESRRSIKLLRPEFLEPVVRELESLMKVS